MTYGLASDSSRPKPVMREQETVVHNDDEYKRKKRTPRNTPQILIQDRLTNVSITIHSRKQVRLFVDERGLSQEKGVSVSMGGAVHGHTNLVFLHGLVSPRTVLFCVLAVGCVCKHTKDEERSEDNRWRPDTLAHDHCTSEREPASGACGRPFSFFRMDHVVL